MVWLLALLYRVPLKYWSSRITLQEGSQQLSQDVASILQGQNNLEIRTSRFFVKGQGYKYRVVITVFQHRIWRLNVSKIWSKEKSFGSAAWTNLSNSKKQRRKRPQKKFQREEVQTEQEVTEPVKEKISRSINPEVNDVFIHARMHIS